MNLDCLNTSDARETCMNCQKLRQELKSQPCPYISAGCPCPDIQNIDELWIKLNLSVKKLLGHAIYGDAK